MICRVTLVPLVPLCYIIIIRIQSKFSRKNHKAAPVLKGNLYFCAFNFQSHTVMHTVQVRDKRFAISIPEAKIKERVAEIAAQISSDFEGKKPIFLVVLNGAFIFAADLIRGVSADCEVTFVRFSSYKGTASTGDVQQVLGIKEDLRGRTVVIVEDIIDSGLTMKELVKTVKALEPKEVHIAALLVKPDNMRVQLDIPYCCFRIPNDFILGYGLDYDGEGRNLKDIYTVIN